jgi:secreted trypsin-like serine protease
MVSVLKSSIQENLSAHLCGASLVNSNWVLTAAHCVNRFSASQIHVIVGAHDLTNGDERIKVARIVVYSGFDEDTRDNDIALLELSTAVAAKAIDIAVSEPQDKTPSVVAGWGYSSESDRVSTILQKVGVPIVNREACNASLDREITERMICAGFAEGGKDACEYDSGGPLMIVQDSGGYLLGGIVSWGKGCAREGYYGVYTNVAWFGDWITQNIH